MLVDIWTEMARPAIELDRAAPSPRRGGLRRQHRRLREPYRRYFEFVDDPANGFRTMTLPFEGGFELTVKA